MKCCLLSPEVGQLAVQGVPQVAEGAQVDGPQVTGTGGRGQVTGTGGRGQVKLGQLLPQGSSTLDQTVLDSVAIRKTRQEENSVTYKGNGKLLHVTFPDDSSLLASSSLDMNLVVFHGSHTPN